MKNFHKFSVAVGEVIFKVFMLALGNFVKPALSLDLQTHTYLPVFCAEVLRKKPKR